MPEAHGEAIVEALGEERWRPLRFNKAQQGISELRLVRGSRELRGCEVRWEKWPLGHGDLHAKKKGQPQPTLLLALVETVSASLEHSPNGYAITRTC